MEERIVKKLMTSVKCNCGQNYQLPNVSILGHHNEMWFFRAYCPSCQNSYLIAATVSAGENPVISDLSPAEFCQFSKDSQLTTDDFLDMHNFLNGFDGDFNRLFKFSGSEPLQPNLG